MVFAFAGDSTMTSRRRAGALLVATGVVPLLGGLLGKGLLGKGLLEEACSGRSLGRVAATPRPGRGRRYSDAQAR